MRQFKGFCVLLSNLLVYLISNLLLKVRYRYDKNKLHNQKKKELKKVMRGQNRHLG